MYKCNGAKRKKNRKKSGAMKGKKKWHGNYIVIFWQYCRPRIHGIKPEVELNWGQTTRGFFSLAFYSFMLLMLSILDPIFRRVAQAPSQFWWNYPLRCEWRLPYIHFCLNPHASIEINVRWCNHIFHPFFILYLIQNKLDLDGLFNTLREVIWINYHFWMGGNLFHCWNRMSNEMPTYPVLCDHK